MISYTKLSPNNSGKRIYPLQRITPHCVVGQLSVESLGGIFCDGARKVSSNYGIGADGRIALYVNEDCRSWCSSNADNDQRAITIECASDLQPPYTFKPIVYNQLIALCIDICRRNDKTKLIWIDDKEKSLSYPVKSNELIITVHRWFADRECPGDWLYNRLGELAEKVTIAISTPPFKVEAKNAQVRRGPGTNYTWTGQLLNCARTIEKIEDGKDSICSWGKIDNGWIALDNCRII